MEEKPKAIPIEVIPGNGGRDCPANGVHYDEKGNLIDFFCDSCHYWEQCEEYEE